MSNNRIMCKKMKKLYQMPDLMVVTLSMRQILCTSPVDPDDPDVPIDPVTPADPSDPVFTKRNNSWDDEDWD